METKVFVVVIVICNILAIGGFAAITKSLIKSIFELFYDLEQDQKEIVKTQIIILKTMKYILEKDEQKQKETQEF